MPYRPRRRRVPTGGNGAQRKGSPAARVALSRHNARKRKPSGPSALLALVLVIAVAGVSLVSVGVIAAGGAAGVTIATLNQGLPDVKAFSDLDYWEPTTIYDRKGKQILAQFWEHRREVVEFDEVPQLILDVTTATEDDTFWDNPGVDLEATTRALLTTAAGGNTGGASTITQQLVRARLLPEEVVADDNTREGLYLRKAKEILQSYKLTQAFPGEEGKKDIITAYLNEIFYGDAYGIAAAADVYFDKDLDDLTPAEAALLAAIPQSPSKFRLWATDGKGKLTNIRRERGAKKKNGRRATKFYVKTCGNKEDCVETELVQRQRWILSRLRDNKGRWTALDETQYQEALNEKIRIRKKDSIVWKAPHFVNAVLPELNLILGDRDPIQTGGYKVYTTLDMKAQNLAEKYIEAGAVLPSMPASKRFQAIRKKGLGRDAGWINRLVGTNLKNGGMVAMDYRTGDILAYVGSAGYYKKKTPKMNPKYDHVGQGRRQPGSAWKAILYASGIDSRALTSNTLLLDQREQFGPGWSPQNADRTYRGLIPVRKALQLSLNIPAIRALQRTGITTVRKYAVKAGFTFLEDDKMLDRAGLAGALGTVEVRPLDMTAAFGAFGNNGKVTKPRYILRVESPDGKVIYRAGDPITTQVWKPSTAFIMTDILKGNTNPAINPAWGAVFEIRNTRNGARREAAVKTGTTNNLKDYSTYGVLPQPKNKKAPALAVGVWYGNSDSSSPNLNILRYSLDNAGRTWAAFVREYTKGKPAATFQRPKGVVNVGSDVYAAGTQPGGRNQIDSSSQRASGGESSNSGSSADNRGSNTRSNDTGGADRRSGGGGGGGSRGPAPTCKPGSTNFPRGCVIPGAG
jgi:penicillin-binding protein 1A